MNHDKDELLTSQEVIGVLACLSKDLDRRLGLVKTAIASADTAGTVARLGTVAKQIQDIQNGLEQAHSTYLKLLEQGVDIWPTEPAPVLTPKPGGRGPSTPPTKDYWYRLDGHVRSNRDAIRLTIELLKELHQGDPNFLERYAMDPAHGKKKVLVSRKREGLYISSPHLIDKSEQLIPGWWVGTNYGTKELRKRFKIASKVSRRNIEFYLGPED